jgi:hypothetical protein
MENCRWDVYPAREQGVIPSFLQSLHSRRSLAGRCKCKIVPRGPWEALFKSQGMKNPLPRMQMLDGFNEGWIGFESGEAGSRKGSVSLESVLQGLTQQSSAH